MGGREESFGKLVELELPPQSGGIGRRRMKTLALVDTLSIRVRWLLLLLNIILS